MVDLAWAIRLEKMNSPSPSSSPLAVAPWLAVGLCAYLPKTWFDLSLHWSYALCHNHYELVCVTLLSPEDSVFLQPSSASCCQDPSTHLFQDNT